MWGVPRGVEGRGGKAGQLPRPIPPHPLPTTRGQSKLVLLIRRAKRCLHPYLDVQKAVVQHSCACAHPAPRHPLPPPGGSAIWSC